MFMIKMIKTIKTMLKTAPEVVIVQMLTSKEHCSYGDLTPRLVVKRAGGNNDRDNNGGGKCILNTHTACCSLPLFA